MTIKVSSEVATRILQRATPKHVAEELRAGIVDGDPESTGCNFDKTIRRLLVDLGYSEAVRVMDDTETWRA